MPAGKKDKKGLDNVFAEKDKEIAEYVDQLKRLQAEFENYKKRAAREREEHLKYANEQLILKLLEVLDDFDRALEASEVSRECETLRSGLDLTSKKLHGILEAEGLSRIEAVGKVFDPLKHEALLVEHSDEHSEDVVIGELDKGYELRSKVIRPCKVKVCKKVN